MKSWAVGLETRQRQTASKQARQTKARQTKPESESSTMNVERIKRYKYIHSIIPQHEKRRRKREINMMCCPMYSSLFHIKHSKLKIVTTDHSQIYSIQFCGGFYCSVVVVYCCCYRMQFLQHIFQLFQLWKQDEVFRRQSYKNLF